MHRRVPDRGAPAGGVSPGGGSTAARENALLTGTSQACSMDRSSAGLAALLQWGAGAALARFRFPRPDRRSPWPHHPLPGPARPRPSLPRNPARCPAPVATCTAPAVAAAALRRDAAREISADALHAERSLAVAAPARCAASMRKAARTSRRRAAGAGDALPALPAADAVPGQLRRGAPGGRGADSCSALAMQPLRNGSLPQAP